MILDAQGLEYPLNSISDEDIYVCFDLPLLYPYLCNAGIAIPLKLIDLKTETCLIHNTVGKQGESTIFHMALHEMVKHEKLELIAPDGEIWLHPAFANSDSHIKRESVTNARRHASWQLKLWQKYSSSICTQGAINRGGFNLNVCRIAQSGIGIDVEALKQIRLHEPDIATALNGRLLDGRNISCIKPFATSTGRNSTSSLSYPLSIKANYRNLISPDSGNCLIHLDYKRQEIGIAAALSQDALLLDLYKNNCPYAWFANQVNPAVPMKLAKRLFIAIQYGAQLNDTFIRKMSLPAETIRKLYSLHHEHFSAYWSWTNKVLEDAYHAGQLTITDGWRVRVNSRSSPLSIINWPIQATGALLLRNVVNRLVREKILPIGLNHDAILLETPYADAKLVTQHSEAAMQDESEKLFGLRLKVSIDIGQPNQSLLEILEDSL